MNAVIDFGNTFAKLGFFEQNTLIEVQKGLEMDALKQALEAKSPEYLIISSVTKSLEELELLFEEYQNKLFLTPQTQLPR